MQKISDPKIEADLPFSSEIASEPNQAALTDASTADAQFEGVELSAYADQNDLTTADVWALVRQGELAARTQRGKVYVYDRALEDEELIAEEAPQAATSTSTRPITSAAPAFLPPLPTASTATPASALVPQQPAPEIALLLDHLSLAKEEHREIIRLTQDSITRITSMTEQLLAAKDTTIRDREEQLASAHDEVEMRDQKIAAMEQQMADRDAMVTKLRQELEDMEILTKTLSNQ